MPEPLTAALRELGRCERSTLFMVLLAGFQALLSRLSGQDDLLVGTPVANRGHHLTEGLIGFFLNTIVLRGDLSGEPSFRELVGRARERALAAFAHDLRYEDIPAAVRERAKHLMLDATGIALASAGWDFAHKTLTAVQGLAGGTDGVGACTVLGLPARLPLRDAVLVNGVLVHGLRPPDV